MGETEQDPAKFNNRSKRNDHYSIPYFEVSAKSGDKVNESFMEMARLAVIYEAKKAVIEQ